MQQPARDPVVLKRQEPVVQASFPRLCEPEHPDEYAGRPVRPAYRSRACRRLPRLIHPHWMVSIGRTYVFIWSCIDFQMVERDLSNSRQPSPRTISPAFAASRPPPATASPWALSSTTMTTSCRSEGAWPPHRCQRYGQDRRGTAVWEVPCTGTPLLPHLRSDDRPESHRRSLHFMPLPIPLINSCYQHWTTGLTGTQ